MRCKQTLFATLLSSLVIMILGSTSCQNKSSIADSPNYVLKNDSTIFLNLPKDDTLKLWFNLGSCVDFIAESIHIIKKEDSLLLNYFYKNDMDTLYQQINSKIIPIDKIAPLQVFLNKRLEFSDSGFKSPTLILYYREHKLLSRAHNLGEQNKVQIDYINCMMTILGTKHHYYDFVHLNDSLSIQDDLIIEIEE